MTSAAACRLCRGDLSASPKLTIAPAPSGAQHFAPTPAEARARTIALAIVECGACGLVQSVSAPVDGYRRAISAAGVSAPMREHRASQARRLRELVPDAGVKLLLVGCGSGYELSLIADAGFAPEGLEWGGAPKSYDGSWPVHDGYPGDRIPGAPFGAFACFNFLEHADDPRGFLAAIGAALTATGVGVIEVPNYARQRAAGRAADYVADHLSYFDAHTLRAMLTLAGFDVLGVAEVRGGENIEAIVRRRAVSALERDAELLGAAQTAIAEFFARWKKTGTPAVVWGASHQALTLLAGLKDGAQPRAIVDSAPFKRGLFAPPAGIPVVGPSADAVSGVGAVLVIASGYEPEIARTLRGELSFTGEIWTVRGHELHRLD